MDLPAQSSRLWGQPPSLDSLFISPCTMLPPFHLAFQLKRFPIAPVQQAKHRRIHPFCYRSIHTFTGKNIPKCLLVLDAKHPNRKEQGGPGFQGRQTWTPDVLQRCNAWPAMGGWALKDQDTQSVLLPPFVLILCVLFCLPFHTAGP